MRSRLPTLFLALLCALPLGFLPRLLGERTEEPLDLRPTWAQLVVVTCGALPAAPEPPGPGWRTLAQRAATAALRIETAAPEAAALLWTGRAPAGPWSLAESARRTGAATAAYLAAPLATRAGIAGFDTLVESPELTPERLAALAGDHLAAHPDERQVLWLHLADAGPRGEALDELLARLHDSLAAHGHRWDALVVVTSLPDTPAAAPVPLWVELPNALYAGRRGQGTAGLAAVAGTLRELLRLPGPDVTRGEPPLPSSPDLATLLRGGALETP